MLRSSAIIVCLILNHFLGCTTISLATQPFLSFKQTTTLLGTVLVILTPVFNSVNPDQTAPKEQSDQDQHCLSRQAVRSLRVITVCV